VFSTPTLFYNADIFRAAGLDPNRPPRTWDEMKAMGTQIRERTGRPALYIACIELDWCTQSIHLSNGGRVLSQDRKTIMFGQPETVESLKIWQDLFTAGVHLKQTGAEALDSFSAGNLAMYVNTSAVQGRLIASAANKWDLKSGGLPAFGTKQVRPTNSGSGLAIMSNDPLKKRAAWELMKYLTTEESFVVITSEIGYLPLRPSIVNDARYLKDWVAKNPQILPNLEQLAGLEPSVAYPGDNHAQIRTIYLQAIQRVLLNGDDPERTMRDAAARGTELMPRR
jgi:multiple sugar transport system substrate-binding protein